MGPICLAATVFDSAGSRCRNVGELRLLGIGVPDRISSRPCRWRSGDHVCSDPDQTGGRYRYVRLLARLRWPR